ncbi:MAG: hypothetical protein ACR2FY_10580 [Pirellulaceae bacterium]
MKMVYQSLLHAFRSEKMKTPPLVEMLEETDPIDLAKARERRAQFDKNSAWLQARIPEVYSQHRGKVICIAGEELFAADSTSEAVATATAAHPEDKGYFTRYIPQEKVPRVYAI